MNLFILAGVIILSVVIAVATRRSGNSYAREEQDFWDREHAANFVRRKSLDDLDYIVIPTDELPVSLHHDNDIIVSCTDTIVELAKTEVVNLTGISNTDLKLKYGTANITSLTLYDQRYTLLASTLQKWADELMSLNDVNAARTVLEYAVSTGTDVSSTYKSLASIYASNGETDLIRSLIPKVKALNTPLKDSIIRSLETYLDQ